MSDHNKDDINELEELGMSLDWEEEGTTPSAADGDIEIEALAVGEEGEQEEAAEPAEVSAQEMLTETQIVSIVESVLFATDRPQSVAQIKQAFAGTNVRSSNIRRALELLQTIYAGADRGVTVEEVNGGYQLRTKVDNLDYLRRMLKIRPFRLSGPALEVLAIVAYKQPCPKSDIDVIRGVESGHLLRGLMDRSLVQFAGKSDLPGKPMLYATTRRFLEIFGLRNLRELPSLTEIDELIPEGIGEEEQEVTTLGDLTGELSQKIGTSYSEGEEELERITFDINAINTSSDFFEQEKQRQKERRDAERAQDIRDALAVGEKVEEKDVRWLQRFEEQLRISSMPESVAPDSVGAIVDTETPLSNPQEIDSKGELPPEEGANL
jgi:segregation and condensation protein B